MIRKIRNTLRHLAHSSGLIMLAMTITLIMALAGWALYQRLVIAAHQGLVQTEVQHRAVRQAAEVDRFVAAWRQRLSDYAGNLAQSGEDLETLSDRNDQLLVIFPQAKAVHLLMAEENVFIGEKNFVALDMVRRAFNGEQPQPEAVKLEQWDILFAQPVFRDNEVRSVLVVSLPTTLLTKALTALDIQQGATQILQQAPNAKPQPFIILGSAANANMAQRATAVDHWQVVYRATPALSRQVAKPMLLFSLSVMGLTLLLILALAGLCRLALRKPLPASDGDEHANEEALARQVAAKMLELDASVFEMVDEEETSAETAPRKKQPAESQEEHASGSQQQPSLARIFRDYDIRGLAGEEIDSAFATRLGKALGTRALASGETALVVGIDGRTSSPELGRALMAGILATGCDVVDLGQVPTPLMNFALKTLEVTDSGVMVTASHNPAPDNGFKMVMRGAVLSSGEVAGLQSEMSAGNFRVGAGKKQTVDIRPDYLTRVKNDIMPLNNLRVVLDCGNGIAGLVAPDLLRALGAQVTELYCDPDGSFPNHDPDPLVTENLKDLITVVAHEKADIGLAIDGDGDRLVAVSSSGRIVWPDELLLIFVRDVLARNPGADVVFDVKSTRRLHALVNSYGGRPVMWKTGHAHMRNKIAETAAPVGGEFSGHLFFNDRWYGFDDGIYAAARLLEIMVIREQGLDDILAAFPAIHATPEIKVVVEDEKKFELIHELQQKGQFDDGKINNIDGVRVDFPDAWGLVRASNTVSALTMRFEADNGEALKRVKALFREQLLAIAPGLTLDF